MITQGSKEHPVQLNDHFFGPKIKEVHWGGGVIAILEVVSDTFDQTEITSVNPLGAPFREPFYHFWNCLFAGNDDFEGPTITKEKYNDKDKPRYIIEPDISKVLTTDTYIDKPGYTRYFIESYIDYSPIGKDTLPDFINGGFIDWYGTVLQPWIDSETAFLGYGPTATFTDEVYNYGYSDKQYLLLPIINPGDDPYRLAKLADANLGYDGKVVNFNSLFVTPYDHSRTSDTRTIIYWTRSKDFPPTNGYSNRSRTSYLANFAKTKRVKAAIGVRRQSGAPHPSLEPNTWNLKFYEPGDFLIDVSDGDQRATIKPVNPNTLPISEFHGEGASGSPMVFEFNNQGIIPPGGVITP